MSALEGGSLRDDFAHTQGLQRGIGGRVNGHDFEVGVLGAPHGAREDKSRNKESAFAFVRAHQEGIVLSQSVRELRKNIANYLSQMTRSTVHPHQIGFFSALGTALDINYGVDAFFEYNYRGVKHVATVDVSMNTEKLHTSADVLFRGTLNADGIPTFAEQEIQDAGMRIARILLGIKPETKLPN